MAKAKEIRDMSDEQINLTWKEASENLFRLRMQAQTEKLDAPSELKKSSVNCSLPNHPERAPPGYRNKQIINFLANQPHSGSLGYWIFNESKHKLCPSD
jgi:large subunit ribosomal protein L29